MPKEYFRFKQFTVRQDRCAMKVSTDGVLLGAWTDHARAARILDLGTGTGLLALIAAQRQPSARIDALDIDPEAVAQAARNMADSPWPQRLRVFQGDARTWAHPAPYDLQLCNPPFYAGHRPSADPRRAVARHDGTLRLPELMEAMAARACPDGRISLIVPFDRWAETVRAAEAQGFRAVRSCQVRYVAWKPPKRVLLECARNNGRGEERSELTVQRLPGVFSDAYQALLRDLELHF